MTKTQSQLDRMLNLTVRYQTLKVVRWLTIVTIKFCQR